MEGEYFASNPEHSDNDIEVAEGAWRHTADGRLTTKNISSCTVVAIYNPITQSGYLGHFRYDESEQRQQFNEMLKVVRERESVHTCKAWLGGATLLDDEFYNETIELEKLTYEEALEEAGVLGYNIVRQWLGKNEKINLFVLDCVSGEVHFEKRSFSQ